MKHDDDGTNDSDKRDDGGDTNEYGNANDDGTNDGDRKYNDQDDDDSDTKCNDTNNSGDMKQDDDRSDDDGDCKHADGDHVQNDMTMMMEIIMMMTGR